MTARIAKSLLAGFALAYAIMAFRVWSVWPGHWSEIARSQTTGAALFIAVVLFIISAISAAHSDARR